MSHILTLGWKEYCALPQFKIPLISAKIDTGADTSCLHAFELEPFTERGQLFLNFKTHPKRFNDEKIKICTAPVIDYRLVRSSNGDHEQRYVIATQIIIGNAPFLTELTLSNRSELNFRMLLGRAFLSGNALVDVCLSLHQGKPDKNLYRQLRQEYRHAKA